MAALHDDDRATVDSLLADLQGRLVSYMRGDHADPTLVLAEEAEANARELWRAAQAAPPGLSVPFDVVYAIALLYFYRYAALPLGQDRNDLQVALVLFAHIYRIDPELVPKHLLQMQTSDDDDEPVIPDNVGLVWDHSLMFPAFPDSYSSRNYPFSDSEIIVGPDWWMRQADVLLKRAQTGDDPEAVERVISLLRQAVQHTPSDHPAYAERLSRLSRALLVQFERTGKSEQLDEAVEYGRAAVAATPQDDHQRAAILNNLGAALGIKFRHRGNLADLDDAIAICRKAVEVAPGSHPGRVTFLGNLGNSLGNRIDRTDDPADLDEYIAVYRSAAEMAHADDPLRTEILTRLDKGLRMRFQRTGDRADAEEVLHIEEMG